MNKKLFHLSFFSLIFLPSMAFAVVLPGVPGQVANFNIIINGILNLIWPIFIGFAVIMFIVAGFFFIKAQGEPDELKTARDFLIWGVVGVAVAVMAFTIPYFIQGTIITGGVGGGNCKLYRAFCGSDAECCNGVCAMSFNTAAPVCN